MEHEFRQLIRHARRRGLRARDCSMTPTSRPKPCAPCGDRITPAAELILPGIHLDVVAFGCTSASMELGEEEVFRQIRQGTSRGCLHHAGHRRLRRVQGARCTAHRRADALRAGGQRRRARLSEPAWRRGRGLRHVRQARRPGRRAHLGGLDRRRDRDAGAQRPAGCDLHLVHQPAARRSRSRRSRQRSACRSRPAITRWPGIACACRG